MSQVNIITENNINKLLSWRMEVLHCVFAIPQDVDITALEASNRQYYERHLADGSHIACLAQVDGETIGCGGLCLYDEMPSPDNPDGHCAYLMNIYVREAWRGKGMGTRIVRWLVGQALSRGIQKVYLETSNNARNLYLDMGFNYMKDMMQLEKNL